MKKSILLSIVLSITLVACSQNDKKTLVTIDGDNITVGDFRKVYEKNLDVIESDDAKDVENNLDLYINYKLKVKEAYALKLDTLKSYVREMETYRNELSAPYLQDKEFTEKLIKEAYFRTKNEIKASHILIKMKEDEADTLTYYNKIIEARNKIVNGDNFDEVAVEYSEDGSVKTNKGDLGYFSAFKMVYPFEDAAFNTKLGEVSKPFRTSYGYHIVKVVDTRISVGELEVAHIYLRDLSDKGKIKIDSIYQKLENKESFEELVGKYSEDQGSKAKGGRLQKFGTGRMIKQFEDAAYALKNENDFSKPVKSKYGWHIIKLIKKYPVGSFEESKGEITTKIKSSGRMKLSDEAVLNKLKKKYTIKIEDSSKNLLKKEGLRATPSDSLQNNIVTINGKQIKEEAFVSFIKSRRHKSLDELLDMFIDAEVLKYYKENLINTEPEYAQTLKEYEDGLLLFELMQQKVWDKSSKDTIGLQKHFEANKELFKDKTLEDNKGEVINNYQEHLEKSWIESLRQNSTIDINKKQLKKLVKFYEKRKKS
ncbi:peptidyl-prolyl cis-trans isomerase SurA [Lutibacter sp. Hel_I_33_5]|uniref:peptidylprolyl isomerase n=1 Tax=Lutibacter sp. Hel_I_33_5 TaxID=1566289 RepID=UPI0011A4F84D|nr:peptidylprolyl isomerase [Lutibacter sp. Hel_I_33_5]TVZ57240.1 peptidyl-prolyl cis-trans isomerase SurA [Lutibacter sp. Hel_I_33_5]